MLFRTFATELVKRTGNVNRLLLRYALVLMLLGGLLGIPGPSMAKGIASERHQGEERIEQHDGWLNRVAEERQRQLAHALRPASPSPRVASSRTVRLLPTHGGKPDNSQGCRATAASSHHLNCTTLTRGSCLRLRVLATSPRYYYVIALRRILC